MTRGAAGRPSCWCTPGRVTALALVCSATPGELTSALAEFLAASPAGHPGQRLSAAPADQDRRLRCRAAWVG